MRASRAKAKSGAVVWLLMAAVLLAGSAIAQAQNKRVTIYSPGTTFSIDVLSVNGKDYVGIVDLLEPLGRIESHLEGQKFKLRFNSYECEFQGGQSSGRVRGKVFDMSAPFTVTAQHGYLPLAAMPGLLARLTDQAPEYHANARRLFLGVGRVRFKAELQRSPSRLVLTFPMAVTPNVNVQPGHVRLTFLREPLTGLGNESATYGDTLISSTSFSELNGATVFMANVAQPATVSFAEGNRQIIISQAGAANAPKAQPSKAAETPLPPPKFDRPAAKRFLVVIDASHGGTDSGDAITPDLAEKTVTLALARRLSRDLEARGISVQLLRTTDATISLDQRAQTANAARPALYVALHAGSSGHGVRVYTALLPPSATTADRHSFLPWETAQSAWLDRSNAVARAVYASCQDKQIPVRASSVPLRPLNNLAAAAIAVEVAGLDEKNTLSSPKYKDALSAALTQAILNARQQLEEAQ